MTRKLTKYDLARNGPSVGDQVSEGVAEALRAGSGHTVARMDGTCSRCHQKIVDYRPPDGGMTAGYYLVTAWRHYANAGEVIVCDECMWRDARYIADYGPRPKSPPVPTVSEEDVAALTRFANASDESDVEVFGPVAASRILAALAALQTEEVPRA